MWAGKCVHFMGWVNEISLWCDLCLHFFFLKGSRVVIFHLQNPASTFTAHMLGWLAQLMCSPAPHEVSDSDHLLYPLHSIAARWNSSRNWVLQHHKLACNWAPTFIGPSHRDQTCKLSIFVVQNPQSSYQNFKIIENLILQDNFFP